MAHPEFIYWGLVLLIAVPLAPFNNAAWIVLGMRVANQLAYESGWDEAQSQGAIYTLGAVLGFALARGRCCDVVSCFSVVLAAIAWSASQAIISPIAWWWAIYLTAIMQLLFVPFCTDTRSLRNTIRAVRDPSLLDRLDLALRRLAWAM